MDKIPAQKEKGNSAHQVGDFSAAIRNYSEALARDGGNYILFSNRSAALTKAGRYEDALSDAEKTISLNPNWGKGYLRKGTALAFLGRFEDALKTFKEGISRDPENEQLKEVLEEVEQQQLEANEKITNPFQLPNAVGKLRANPRTRRLMNDPEFAKLATTLSNTSTTLGHLLGDKRVLTALGVLLDLDLKVEAQTDLITPPLKKPSMKADPVTPTHTNDGKMDKPMSKGQLAAERERNAGNGAYKKKDFYNALKHYFKAVKFDSTNIIYLVNIAVVYYEQKRFQLCIEQCQKAVKIGRENHADYKLIAKAFQHGGNAYRKLGNLHAAQLYYEKSMAEHKTPETKALLAEIMEQINEGEKLAYVDLEKAEEANERANNLFNKGNYTDAVTHYTEAVKRNPDNPKYYSNRAACYTKLAAFDHGLRDCDKCLAIEPKFVKGWLRKGKIHLAMNQVKKAALAYQRAIEIDPSNTGALEGYKTCTMNINTSPEEIRRRAMADPEVQSIMQDPAMKLILEQMHRDPSAVPKHFKKPDIAAKMKKLLDSGLIAFH